MAADPEMSSRISVADFYTGRNVLITGATGFVGKALVEKLLRSCPKIRHIYLLMRSKKGQDTPDRLQQLLSSPVFDKLRDENPTALNKIIPVHGDITEPNLGLSQVDRRLLAESVSVVFHSAATVKFDETLKLSMDINVLGTKRIIDLCHEMMNLKALIHVSTAYCNCDQTEVKEIIYPPPCDPEAIIRLMECMDEKKLQLVTPHLISSRPNTYTFTKALAEHVLKMESGNLPVAVVRPSIVLSTHHEPVPGWVDNWRGPNGVISALGQGTFRGMGCHRHMICDLIPVDMLVNLMVSVAWKTALTYRDSACVEDIAVYNCTTSCENPITWTNFVETCMENFRKYPVKNTILYPKGHCRSSKTMTVASKIIMHKALPQAMDVVRRVSGSKPIMVGIHERLEHAESILEYFSTHEWRFLSDRMMALQAEMSPEDNANFCFDVRRIQWSSYLEQYVHGMRKYLFKEDPETLPHNRRKLQRLYWLRRCYQLVPFLLALQMIGWNQQILGSIWGLLRQGLQNALGPVTSILPNALSNTIINLNSFVSMQ